MSRPTTMTCRVRGISLNTSPFTQSFPYDEAEITLCPPLARRKASQIARQASKASTSAVFFVETLGESEWVNKDVWYRGYQYEIVGNKIPGFPPSISHQFIIEA